MQSDALSLAKALLEGGTLWADECAFMTSIRAVARALIDTSAKLERARKAIEDAPCEPGCLSKLRPGTPTFLPCNCAWKARALADIWPAVESKKEWRCTCNVCLPGWGAKTSDGYIRCVNCKRVWILDGIGVREGERC